MNGNHDEFSTVNLNERPWGVLRRKLYIIIFEADTKLGRLFDVVLLWMIVLSIFAVILESDKAIQQSMGVFSIYLEWVLTAFFTVEYFLRLYVSKRPLNYAKSFFGVIDFLAVAPTYISFLFPGAQYLMVVRVLRLLRVFRILKLARFIRAASSLGEALKSSRHKILIFLGVMVSLVLILGTCMHILEGEQVGFSSIPKSMYWAIVTMTTVGYGDIVPMTVLGKFLASMMMLIGYAIIAVPTGIVTAEMTEFKKVREGEKACKRCKEMFLQGANYCHKCGESTVH